MDGVPEEYTYGNVETVTFVV